MEIEILTERNLNQLDIPPRTIDFLVRNKLIPLHVHILGSIDGDYNEHIEILKRNILEASIEVDNNNNIISYDGIFTKFKAEYDDNNKQIKYITKNHTLQYEYGDNGMLLTKKHIVGDEIILTVYRNGVYGATNNINDCAYKVRYTENVNTYTIHYYRPTNDTISIDTYEFNGVSTPVNIEKSLTIIKSQNNKKKLQRISINKTNTVDNFDIDSVYNGGKLSPDRLKQLKLISNSEALYTNNSVTISIKFGIDNYITAISLIQTTDNIEVITKKYFTYDINYNIIKTVIDKTTKSDHETVNTYKTIETTSKLYSDNQLKQLGSLKIQKLK